MEFLNMSYINIPYEAFINNIHTLPLFNLITSICIKRKNICIVDIETFNLLRRVWSVKN